MKIIAIPDIHGSFIRLEDLFSKLESNYNLNDYKIIFLGDYIDRENKNKDVIDFLIDLNIKYDCEFLIGNHDNMLLKTITEMNNDYFDDWLNNNGLSTINNYIDNNKLNSLIEKKTFRSLYDSYYDSDQYIYNIRVFVEEFLKVFPNNHLEFFKNLKLYYKTDKYFFVHAGIDLDKPFNENTIEDFTWIRPPFFINDEPLYPFNKKIIFGHTPTNVLCNGQYIGIDFKAFDKNGMLVAYDPDKHTILEISQKE